MEDKLVYKELSYKIVGLLYKTHQELGTFRNEKQYADYFEKLLTKEKIKYVREYRFNDIKYGGNKARCIIDFIIKDKIILEFKTKDFITKADYFQVKRYLVTLNLKLALLINFRQKRLSPKRILNKDFTNS